MHWSWYDSIGMVWKLRTNLIITARENSIYTSVFFRQEANKTAMIVIIVNDPVG